MYHRLVLPILKQFSKIYFMVGVVGPSHAGKATLAREAFPDLPYISCISLDIRSSVETDPARFLRKYPEGAIFDHIEYCPELIPFLRDLAVQSIEKGKYILISSFKNDMFEGLAGHIGTITLLPLSLAELGMPLDRDKNIFCGGYPQLYDKDMLPKEFFRSHLHSYIERDLRQIINVENLITFQRFMKACAARVGQLLNLTSLAQDCGISNMTARRWLSILEDSYIVFLLQPSRRSFGRRVVKVPKLYFYDTGVACSLLGIENKQQISAHYLYGSLYENMVVVELLKGRLNQARTPNLYFWRDKTGHEVDVVGEWGGRIKAIEIKTSATFHHDYVKNLHFFYNLTQSNPDELVPTDLYLVYGGDYDKVLLQTHLVPFEQMDRVIKENN